MRVFCLKVLIAFLILFSLPGCKKIEYTSDIPLDRDDFGEIDLEDHMKTLTRSDKSAVEFWDRMGLPNQLSQVQATDPVDVGLHFAGYPNIDDIPPDKVEVYYLNASEVVIIVLATGLGDDSVLDKEQRIDLRRDGLEWKVVWAGYRQRCRRAHNPNWITGLCP